MPGWKYAFTLSGRAVKTTTPPGTVRLIEHSIIQRRGRYVDRVVHFPVPNAGDPADPLNWHPLRKLACILTLSLYAFVSNFVRSSIAPALVFWDVSFPDSQKSVEELSWFIASNVLVLGLGNIVWVPLANTFGRRPVLILSTLTLFVSSLYGCFTLNFDHVLIVRILQGLGSAVSETVAPAIIGDLYFVHERGRWMALYIAFLASGSVTGGLCGGYIASWLGWFGIFWVCTALSGTVFLCTALLVPETLYDRTISFIPTLPTSIQTPMPPRRVPRWSPLRWSTLPYHWHSRPAPAPCPYLSLTSLPSMHITVPSRFLGTLSPDPEVNFTWYRTSSSCGGSDISSTLSMTTVYTRRTSRSTVTSPYSPYTFLQSLKFGTYRGKFIYHLIQPWTTLRLPAVWVCMLQYGCLVGGAAVMSTVGPQLLGSSPYDWGQNTGLLFVGALVGIILGGVYAAVFTDARLKKLARNQDHGYAEPESRLSVMIPALGTATAGFLVFGFCAHYYPPQQYQWVGLEVGFGMLAFGLAQVPAIWFSYLIDAYANLASDCLTMICILRGVIPSAWTYHVNQWIQEARFLIPFGTFAAIMGAFSLLVVPIMWEGKRMRIATARYVAGNQ
ncbi:major facilitator superfamily domain-containing protein [Diplogelasinospora grovesii]|uniref:Major facilitator superfamily domain-containing protein n=1 Tax=Diplogelasinospora grovesii TaxID=303347 RepID=A0AAN6S6U3_9PEZI|nr:major facilitator superfamily domain-containing protein [Diplogelasinospora grovesii]